MGREGVITEREGGGLSLATVAFFRELSFYFYFFCLSVAGRGGLTALGMTCSSTLRWISPRDAARKEADR